MRSVLTIDLAPVGQSRERAHDDGLRVDEEVASQCATCVGHPPSVSAQGAVLGGHPGADLVLNRGHPVRDTDDELASPVEATRHVGDLRFVQWVEEVLALDVERLAT